MNDSLLAVMFSLCSAVMAASFSLIVRRGKQHGNATTGVLIGLIVSTPGLVAATLWFWEPSWWNFRALILFSAAGLTGPVLGRIFMYLAIHNLGVSRSMPLMATNPVFTAVLAYSILGERPGPYIWAGTLFVASGCAAITIKSHDDLHWNRRLLWMPFAAVAGFAISNLFRKAGMLAVPSPIFGVTITTLSGLVFLSLLGLFMSSEYSPNLRSGKAWVFYGVCGSINTLAFLANFAAIRYGDLTVVSPLFSTAPFFALLLSAIFLRDVERLTVWIVAGTAFIVSGGLIIAWRVL